MIISEEDFAYEATPAQKGKNDRHGGKNKEKPSQGGHGYRNEDDDQDPRRDEDRPRA